MKTIRTHARWQSCVRPLLWLFAIASMFLSGCKSEPANFTMVKTTNTNLTVIVTPDPVFITHPTPLTTTITTGKEQLCHHYSKHKDSCSVSAKKTDATLHECPFTSNKSNEACCEIATHCPNAYHCGCKPVSESGTELTTANLLTLLGVLVALSAYLANVRRAVIPKSDMELDKAKEFIQAKLEAAKQKAITNSGITQPDVASLEKAIKENKSDERETLKGTYAAKIVAFTELEAAITEAVWELKKIPASKKIKETTWLLFLIGIADACFIIAIFCLGIYIRQKAFHYPCWDFLKSMALIGSIGVFILLFPHFRQIWKSISKWWKICVRN